MLSFYDQGSRWLPEAVAIIQGQVSLQTHSSYLTKSASYYCSSVLIFTLLVGNKITTKITKKFYLNETLLISKHIFKLCFLLLTLF